MGARRHRVLATRKSRHFDSNRLRRARLKFHESEQLLQALSPGLWTYGKRSCRIGVVLDFVAENEIGAGVAGADGGELVQSAASGLGARRGGERVEPDEQLAWAGADVAGGGRGFADERV